MKFPASLCLSFFHQPHARNNGLLLIAYDIQLVMDLDKSMKYKCTVWIIGKLLLKPLGMVSAAL
jgi:hypothetical protein